MSISPELRTWYYFGCGGSVGHHLYDRHHRRHYVDQLTRYDGQLCHTDTTLYHAKLTRLPQLGYSALAWWDHTVDKRTGSNSIIFVPNPEASLESIREGMKRWFPWVENRLPRPLIVI